MTNNIPPYLLRTPSVQYELTKVKRAKLTFLDKTLLNSAGAVKSIFMQAESAAKEYFIQNIDPRIKLISLIYLKHKSLLWFLFFYFTLLQE
jgi:hypothetical protein